MDSGTQFLYDYVIWQWPIRWVVTLAFYAFAFKLTAGVLRHILLALIGFKRWANAEYSLAPEDPTYWKKIPWVKPNGKRTQSLLLAFHRWLAPLPPMVATETLQERSRFR